MATKYKGGTHMSTALVTGATGLVGYNVVQALLEQGRSVRALVRSPEMGARLLPPGCSIVPGDITNVESVRAALRDCSSIFHIAGLVDRWGAKPDDFKKVNVIGTRNLVDAALQSTIRKFVHVSTVMVFRNRGGTEYDEADFDPQPKPSAYDRTKQEAELYVRAGIKRGLPGVVVNPSGVYGPGPTRSHWFQTFIRQLAQGSMPLLPPGGMPYVYSEDVAKGCLLAEEKGLIGEGYILSESCQKFSQLAEVVVEQLGIKRTPAVMPWWVARILATTGAWWSMVTRQPPLIHREYLRLWQLGKARPSNAKARRELGWQPRSFREGVRETIAALALDIHTQSLIAPSA